jgi:protein ImuB
MENGNRQTAFMVAISNTRQSPQWLALHFPHLALDEYKRTRELENADSPLAISDKLKGQQTIIDHNPAAARAGIHVGMPVGAALSLVDSLQLSVRDQRAEQTSLKRLASWCYQYSSQVCLKPQRSSLLLEVAASRRLFGNAETLAKRIKSELQKLGYQTASGIAPTLEAAHLAARHGLIIHTSADIRKHIGKLSIDSLNLQATQIRSLQKMGFRSAAEVFRLPRKALARRLGLTVSNYLDRLLGHRPDPCKTFRSPDSFSAGLDLPDTGHTQGLIFPLKRLLQELCGVLRAHDRGIQVLQIRLQLDEGTQTIRLNLQEATRSEVHLMLLLRERLERLQLPRPVRHIRVQALHFLPCTMAQASLLKEPGNGSMSADNHVIERLQARLGTESVKGIKGLQDHRPEYSWSLRELDEPAVYTAQAGRPAWLLAEPQRCRIANYRILTGPERIETGWWDGRDCRRDYFVVRDTRGSTLWAFHEYKPRPGWYLHGLFA